MNTPEAGSCSGPAGPRRAPASSGTHSPRLRSPEGAACLLAGLFLATALPLILSGHARGRGAADEERHHGPVIERFSRQWPWIDLRDYQAATTPGYHWIMGGAAKLAGTAQHDVPWRDQDRRLLRVVSACFTAALLYLLAGAAGRAVGGRLGFAFSVPVLASIYVFSSGIWLLPDNAGWLGVLLVLLVSLRGDGSPRSAWLGAISLFFVAAVRQSHIWCALPLWLSFLVPAGTTRPAAIREHAGGTGSTGLRSRSKRVELALLSCVPGLALVLVFVASWGGLTPPAFQPDSAEGPNRVINQGFNASALPLLLSMFGVASVFYAPALVAMERARRSRRGIPGPESGPFRRTAAIGALLGVIAGILPLTSYAPPERWSGLWVVARWGPVLAGRSLWMVLLSGLGGTMLALWGRSLGRRDRWLLLGAFLAFAAAQMVNRMAWQRYVEPFVLIWLVLTVSRSLAFRVEGANTRGWTSAKDAGRLAFGPVLLALLLALVTFRNLR